MVDARVHGLDRGGIRTDVNYILEGHNLATAAEPNPPSTRGEGVVYNLVIEHPDATVLWDTGMHRRRSAGGPTSSPTPSNPSTRPSTGSSPTSTRRGSTSPISMRWS